MHLFSIQLVGVKQPLWQLGSRRALLAMHVAQGVLPFLI
jgi:hypothetical protein